MSENAAYISAWPSAGLFGFGPVLTSFDGYKATYQREETRFDRSGTAKPGTLSETALHQQYNALVADRIASTRYRTTKSLTTGFIFFLISLVLFGAHWRWVRRVNGVHGGAAA